MDAIQEVFQVIPIIQQIDYMPLMGKDIGDNTTISSEDSASVTRWSTEDCSMTEPKLISSISSWLTTVHLNHLLAE